jgi:hypothetical protein
MRAGATFRASVLLIREWERQMSSSGCCGRLEGDFLAGAEERCFAERRSIMEAMGPLYLELREAYGDAIEVNVVDPRNMISILPLLVRDFRFHGVSVRDALRTAVRFPVTGVVLNGRVVARGAWPRFSELKDLIGDPPAPWEVVGGLA